MNHNTDSSVTTSQQYMTQLPDKHRVASRGDRETNEGQFREYKAKNELVRGIKLLSRRGKLNRRVGKKRRLRFAKVKQVSRLCEEFQQGYKTNLDELASNPVQFSTVNISDILDKLRQQVHTNICNCLQEQLNVTFDMSDEDVRRKELGDVFFYYLMRGEEPDGRVQKIIHRSYKPLYNHTGSWYELCCLVLRYGEETFTQFYQRLDKNKNALEYLAYKRPQLLFNKASYELLNRLAVYLSYNNLHQIIINVRDGNGQTCIFYTNEFIPYADLYISHGEDLYELLSIRNTNGQTALHVKTQCVTFLLAAIYTPKQRDRLITLTSIKDNKQQNALQVCDEGDRFELLSLIRRVEKNDYMTWSRDGTNILIIYNSTNRPGAEEEAQIIYDACKLKYDKSNIAIEKNKSEDAIITLIKHTAWDLKPLSLIVILMSHGSVGTIDDCDGNPINLSKLEEVMCSDILQGKPKMLITQCCQNKVQEVDEKVKAYAPTHEDFCAVMSCVAGDKSTRGVFLGKLAEQIKNSKADTNIFKLVNSVSREMERAGYKQTPIIMSTLKAEFCPTNAWWTKK